MAVDEPAQDRLVAVIPVHVELVLDKPALDMLAEGMPAQSRLGLLQRERFTAELFPGEQHKMKLPMGKPPWGRGTEQGCPSKSGTGWTCSRQKPERSSGLERTRLGGVYRTVRGLI